MSRITIVRAFDGSLEDAAGVLEVERATFDESPYSPEAVRTMLADGPQRAWLALAAGEVVGFVTAFVTQSLVGRCWEIDLLAVRPDWTGRGLATRLIRAAAAYGAQVAGRTRAAVAADNLGSARAFARAGFRKAEACTLLIRRIEEVDPSPWYWPGVVVREAVGIAEIAQWLPEEVVAGWSRIEENSTTTGIPILLLALQGGQSVGYAELIEVQTLLYRGIWIESLVGATRPARSALIHDAACRASAAGLDEIGAMVPQHDDRLQEALSEAGFQSLGDFYWLSARLPLPGLAAGAQPPPPAWTQGSHDPA